MKPLPLHLPAELTGVVWQYRAAPPGKASPHRHLELEVNLVIGGRATYLVDEGRFDMTSGTMIWLYPRQSHVLVDRSPDLAMWIIVLRPEALARLCTSEATRPMLNDRPTDVFCKSLSPDTMRRVAERFEEAQRLAEVDPARHNAALGHAALCAWAAHQEAGSVTERSDVHPAVERAAMMMHDEDEPRSLDELADAAGLSASHLSRLFKRQTGVSLARYRQRQRLDRFLAIYGRGGRRNLTEAALAAGFGSYPQFHRVFSQHFGYGPAAYRRRLREE